MDQSLQVEKPALLKNDATTYEIALWEARERYVIVIQNPNTTASRVYG